MIVVCPSCQTMYRHQSAGNLPGGNAECSRCDERFPLIHNRRPYLLSEVGPEPTPMRVEAVPEPPPSPTVPWGDGTLAEAASVAEPGETPTRSEGGQSPFLEFVVAVVPSCLGAGLAYYLAVSHYEDPITWAALGGAIGLLLGWACLLWIARED